MAAERGTATMASEASNLPVLANVAMGNSVEALPADGTGPTDEGAGDVLRSLETAEDVRAARA